MKFEFIEKYAAAGLALPERKTSGAAGYDFMVAEDTVIPRQTKQHYDLWQAYGQGELRQPLSLQEVAALTKYTKAKPTLVPTGVKCQLDDGYYLELSVRSSCPLKYWLILANSVGIIDADYYNNPDNEGEIFFQIINLAPFAIQLKRGDAIGPHVYTLYFRLGSNYRFGSKLKYSFKVTIKYHPVAG